MNNQIKAEILSYKYYVCFVLEFLLVLKLLTKSDNPFLLTVSSVIIKINFGIKANNFAFGGLTKWVNFDLSGINCNEQIVQFFNLLGGGVDFFA